MTYANLPGAKVALGVCGGIAAYKVAGLARELTQAGADVRVVMTASAVNFVGPITFSTLTGNPVRTELFPETAPAEIPHTDLGRTSDLIIVAPATAKTMAKAAQGLSDDLMSALLLSAKCPILMAPAMHTEMWLNEATQANVEVLAARGVRIIGPAEGPLAGPDAGVGRLAEISEIIEAADEALGRRVQLAGTRIAITAGGTREPIDAMRFIGNSSSGLMGYELAHEAVRRGADVILITAPTSLVAPAPAETVRVTTAAEMREAVAKSVTGVRALIMAAAVADWRPAVPSPAKLDKADGPPDLRLEPTADILAEVGQRRRAGELPELEVLVGFCAETGALADSARRKLASKGLDMAVANEVGAAGSGAGSESLRALILDREGRLNEVGLVSKRALASLILNQVAERLGEERPI